MSYQKLTDAPIDSIDQVSNGQSTTINMPAMSSSSSSAPLKATTGIPLQATEISGNIGSNPSSSSTQQQQQNAAIQNTLDEPIQETIMRDVRNIWSKIKQVLDPRPNTKENLLKDWDWWGPLLLCLALSVRLSVAAVTAQGPAVFAATFFIIWFGSAVVTLNSQLLGGKISFYQSVCVLGYCIFPLVAASFITWALPFLVKLIVVIAAYLWATYASVNFLSEMNLDNRRLLAIYPIFLFYFMIGWLILITN